jgi:hypothetical protein
VSDTLIVVVEAPSLGEGWLAVSREILERGTIASYDGQATRELALVTLAVDRPDSSDPLSAHVYEPEWAVMAEVCSASSATA